MNRILQMLKLQQELNDSTNGQGWEEGVTKNNKRIDWKRCIYLEAAELIDSYPWKHWKNIDASPDYENIKIEIVDIWHFVMSEVLRVYKVDNRGTLSDIANAIITMPSFNEFRSDEEPVSMDTYEQIKLVENMVGVLFCDNNINALLIAFFTMSAKLNLKLPELYQLYIGKNILNKFRQDNGYKSGEYIKEWHGKEDNVVMQEILNANTEITPEELYDALGNAYPKA
jgi:dimeric dUTPase (all-alpha-NTP-PPase superfamily)